MTVVLVGTGGTIASQPDGLGTLVPVLRAEDLRSWLPSPIRQEVIARDFSVQAGAAMSLSAMQELSVYLSSISGDVAPSGVVVTHGTDTLEETAYFLALTLRPAAPVVLTGAQREASAPDPDGPRNLEDAVRVALTPEARAYGVVVVFDGEIHDPRNVRKVHTRDVKAFSSGSPGPIGLVKDGQVRFLRPPSRAPQFRPSPLCTRVEIISAYAGMDGTLATAAAQAGARGLVVQALGAGNVPPVLVEPLAELVRKGVAVVITSRVSFGPVGAVYGYHGGGRVLLEAGTILAGDLHALKARILLMLALEQTDRASLPGLFAQS